MDKKHKEAYARYVGFGLIMGVAVGFGVGMVVSGPIYAPVLVVQEQESVSLRDQRLGITGLSAAGAIAAHRNEARNNDKLSRVARTTALVGLCGRAADARGPEDG